jgi:hypothetical protein
MMLMGLTDTVQFVNSKQSISTIFPFNRVRHECPKMQQKRPTLATSIINSA